jgi:hypothetical protein
MLQNYQKLSSLLFLIINFLCSELYACGVEVCEEDSDLVVSPGRCLTTITEVSMTKVAIRTDIMDTARFHFSREFYGAALPYLLAAAFGWGDLRALLHLAQYYKDGLVIKSGVTVSTTLTAELVHYGVVSRSEDGQGLFSKDGCPRTFCFGQNFSMAIAIYEDLIARGFTGARTLLANLLARAGEQKHATGNRDEAYALLFKGAELGSAHAAYMLGVMFYNEELSVELVGKVSKQDQRREDLIEAKYFLSLASKQGHAEAKVLLDQVQAELDLLDSPVEEVDNSRPPSPSSLPLGSTDGKTLPFITAYSAPSDSGDGDAIYGELAEIFRRCGR